MPDVILIALTKKKGILTIAVWGFWCSLDIVFSVLVIGQKFTFWSKQKNPRKSTWMKKYTCSIGILVVKNFKKQRKTIFFYTSEFSMKKISDCFIIIINQPTYLLLFCDNINLKSKVDLVRKCFGIQLPHFWYCSTWNIAAAAARHVTLVRDN